MFWFSQLHHWSICSSWLLLSWGWKCCAGSERERKSKDHLRHSVVALRTNVNSDPQNTACSSCAAWKRAVQQWMDSTIPEKKWRICKSALCYVWLCVGKWRRCFPVAFRSSYVSVIDTNYNWNLIVMHEVRKMRLNATIDARNNYSR